MKLRLDYGRTGLTVELPDANLAGVLEPAEAARREVPEEMLRRALADPVGAPRLAEMARGKKSACVVVPDHTRPMPLRLALPPVLEELAQGGLTPDRVLILIATGLHRPTTAAELDAMLGPDIMARYRVANHVAADRAAHRDLGVTTTGVPILVDRRYCEAELRVALGLVEPHFMAGFSGGRKLVCPGLCAEETIRAFHSAALIGHEHSVNLRLEGNLIHRTSAEAAALAGMEFAVNLVLDSAKQTAGVFAGEPTACFRQAAACAAGHATAPIAARAPIVLVTGGGHPLDDTWYQTVKGIVAAREAVEPGGSILVASALAEGIGSADFQELIFTAKSLETFLAEIAAGRIRRNDQWELQEFALVARQARVLLYSDGLPEAVQRRLFVTPVRSVEAGVADCLTRHGPRARILAMPHGPYVLPVMRDGT